MEGRGDKIFDVKYRPLREIRKKYNNNLLHLIECGLESEDEGLLWPVRLLAGGRVRDPLQPRHKRLET